MLKPQPGWPMPIRVAVIAMRESVRHETGAQAAALAYYGFFSLFPLLIALLALLGYIAPFYEFDEQLLRWTTLYLPGAESLIHTHFTRLVAGRGAFGLVGLAGVLWAGSNLFFALARAFNRIWDCQDGRVVWQQRLLALIMVPGFALLLLFSMVFLAMLRSAVWQVAGFEFIRLVVQPWLGIITNLFLPGVLVIGLVFIYRFVPNSLQPWKDVWPGALIAGIALEIARYFFGYYVSVLGPSQSVYGSLTTIVSLMLWIYIASVIILFGAEVAAAVGTTRKRV